MKYLELIAYGVGCIITFPLALVGIYRPFIYCLTLYAATGDEIDMNALGKS